MLTECVVYIYIYIYVCVCDIQIPYICIYTLSPRIQSFVFQFTIQNIKIKTYRTRILRVLYWYETWSIILREESRLSVLENRVLRRIFGPKTDEVRSGKDYITTNFTFSTPHQILLW